GAASGCMELIEAGLADARRDGQSFDAIAGRMVDQARAAGNRLPGFGHRVHSTIDPRVAVLFALAEDADLAADGIRFARALEAAVRDRIRPIPLNIDGALAAILVGLGLPPMIGKLMFIVGRVAGLSAEVLEEYTREKPMRIKIPVAYDGVPPRENGR
ncbi:MAG: citrate/2-methylcitrate synthase, partial [Vicinamibacterales bacterium]